MGPIANTSLVANLETGLRIFAVGFSGVFLNLSLILGVLRLIGWGASRYEERIKAAGVESSDGQGSKSEA